MMEVKGLIWAGTRTDNFDAMLAFCRDVMGMKQAHVEADFARLKLPNGDRFEIFGKKSPYNTFMTRPAVGFLVDDIEAARKEMEGAGIVFIEPIQRTKGGDAWCHFHGPDGFLYSLSYLHPRQQP
jgi:catechol 2,3-dioxygenase-like lactoylglutathione lyase family enzyme